MKGKSTVTNTPSPPDPETLQPEYATQLLQRQDILQCEAQTVLNEFELVPLLSKVGTLRQVGSSTLGLMVWRDIDLAVSSPALRFEDAFEVMRPLYLNAHVRQVRYLNESGSFNLTGQQIYERYYFACLYDTDMGNEWKLDISFWLGYDLHPEPVQDALEQQLTPEMRLTILWIKDIWYQLPAYRTEVYSTDIYDAVLQHNVRTPAQFDAYLARHGKPTRSQRL
jgi:hypothetical protein